MIQLARDLGIRSVSFVRKAEQAPALLALGADHVLTDDEDGMTAAREILGGAQASLAFNAVGGDRMTMEIWPYSSG